VNGLREFRWRLLAVALSVSLPLAIAPVVLAHGARSRPTAGAARALQHRGYRKVKVRCSRSRHGLRCRWSARRSNANCSGALRISGRRNSVRVTAARCHPISSAAAVGSGPVFGFNTFTDPQTVADQRALGATVSRLFVDWYTVEPSPGQWNWQQSDLEYAQMLAGGLRPLIVAFAPPCWARPSTACGDPNFTGPPDPSYDADWITYVHDLAARYPDAVGIEVWNEPNLDQYFLPHADPARFTQLLSEAYGAIKAVDPTMPVISGGLLLSPPSHGTGIVIGGYGADQFLAAMYTDGAQRSMDALGIHVYPSDYVAGVPGIWDPNAMTTWLKALNGVRAAAGESAQPMWITEMGISTATQPGWPAAASDSQQANDLAQMIGIARAHDLIKTVIIHTLVNEATDPVSALVGSLAGDDDAIATGFGVLTSSFQPKPAACTISRLLHGTLTC
jgi:polysaccharide biosynthesis protein PslG